MNELNRCPSAEGLSKIPPTQALLLEGRTERRACSRGTCDGWMDGCLRQKVRVAHGKKFVDDTPHISALSANPLAAMIGNVESSEPLCCRKRQQQTVEHV